MEIDVASAKRRWEHFPHQADIGVRGVAPSPEGAFEEAARALTAVVTDLDQVSPAEVVSISLPAAELEYLLVDWLNAVVYEMSTRKMLFGRFEVRIRNHRLEARAWGEPVDIVKHQPAVEVKGATFTCLEVRPLPEGGWRAQCVVDV